MHIYGRRKQLPARKLAHLSQAYIFFLFHETDAFQGELHAVKSSLRAFVDVVLRITASHHLVGISEPNRFLGDR
jgi:hypothetical protein